MIQKCANMKNTNSPFSWAILYFEDFNYKYYNKVILPSADELRDMYEYENKSKSSSSL